jgi:hypothetical protein
MKVKAKKEEQKNEGQPTNDLEKYQNLNIHEYFLVASFLTLKEWNELMLEEIKEIEVEPKEIEVEPNESNDDRIVDNKRSWMLVAL